ncbi:MAG: TrkH family potassium uptake protein [Clostridiales bacterium]|nr:TrkH family potassium uptake protein [Candidatus Crickella merdequi]
MILPLFIALAYDEESCAWAFLISMLVCFIPGMIVKSSFKKRLEDESVKKRDSYIFVSSAWIVASLVGSIPYMLSGTIDSFFYAFFETCSGFTTTGASVFTDIEHLPHAILIWRCFTQWLGGMGMVVLFAALLPGLGAKGLSISNAETPGPTETRLTARYSDTARKLYFTYIILTFILFVLLMLGKMSPFDALAHSFATMATGGSSTHNAGLAFFDSNYIYFVIGIFTMLAGVNFALFFDVIGGKIRKVIQDEEFRLYFIIIGFSAITMTISLRLSHTHNSIFEDFFRALFQAVNTISTTGFMTSDVNWPSYCVLLMTCLMMIGGCSSSTAGGIKLSRILVAFKIVRAELRSRSHEFVFDDISFNRERIKSSTLYHIYTYTTLFFMTIVVGTFLIGLFGGGSAQTNFLTVISCISSLGPGLDTLGLVCDYHFESNICLLIYNFIMIAGRLEITTLLVLFSRHFWNMNRAFN